MDQTKVISAASHPKTNELIYKLITAHINNNCKILDFGAGQGYMAQKISNYLMSIDLKPEDHLYACEVTPECFEYSDIKCQKISSESTIPFDNQFNVIYAIEVMEHIPRPYDFLHEAYNKLEKGGSLIFSVPNILHFNSRIKFLLTGYGEMFGALSTDPKNAGRICGHIMPLNYSHLLYGLKKCGFNSIKFHVDRKKKGALIPSIIFYPVFKYFSYKYNRSLKKYDEEVWEENKDAVRFMNSLDLLSSRSCVLEAYK